MHSELHVRQGGAWGRLKRNCGARGLDDAHHSHESLPAATLQEGQALPQMGP